MKEPTIKLKPEITVENSYQFIMKWKELIEKGEEPINIHIPDYGTFINCTVTPKANGYTINYDEYKEE